MHDDEDGLLGGYERGEDGTGRRNNEECDDFVDVSRDFVNSLFPGI